MMNERGPSVEETLDIDSQLDHQPSEQWDEGGEDIRPSIHEQQEEPPLTPEEQGTLDNVDEDFIEESPVEGLQEEEGDYGESGGPQEGDEGQKQPLEGVRRQIRVPPMGVITLFIIFLFCALALRLLGVFGDKTEGEGKLVVTRPFVPLRSHPIEDLYLPVENGKYLLNFSMVLLTDTPMGASRWRALETSIRAAVFRILSDLSVNNLKGKKGMTRVKQKVEGFLQERFPRLRVMGLYITNYLII